MKTWLVEIRLKDWKPDMPTGGRVVDYVEVDAMDDLYTALHAGFNRFVDDTKYSPIKRRRWLAMGLTFADICAPDAVVIED